LLTVTVMLDDVLVPPLAHPLVPLTQPATMQWRKGTDVRMK
jgi:hypothetical protein